MPSLVPSQNIGRRWQLGTLSLLIANAVTIFFFLRNDSSIAQVLWIYWLQSVIIGAIAVLRILTFPLQLKTPHNTPGSPLGSYDVGIIIKFFLAGFFIFHYGVFHLVYAVFLAVLSRPDSVITINGIQEKVSFGGRIDFGAILLGGALFAVHHLITYVAEKNARTHSSSPLAVWAAFLKPYARILPMHLIIIFGPIISLRAGNDTVFIVFMILKTIADLVLQIRGVSHPALYKNITRAGRHIRA